MITSRALIIIAAALTAACALKPTRLTESLPLLPPSLDRSATEPVLIKGETVIVDVRRPYDFASSRLPRSISMQWSDFAQADEGRRGLLRQDLFEIARRLARAGIDPDASVVVVGYGAEGAGEEGRVAWMLRYLGVHGARFSAISAFPGPYTSRNRFPYDPADSHVGEPPPRNASMWKPALDPSWIATREEVFAAIEQKKIGREVMLIDVSLESGRNSRNSINSGEASGTMHVPWTDFIDGKGQATCSAVSILNRSSMLKNTRVIAFDELGVASGGVAVALRACGFSNVANFAGGLRELSRAH